MKINKKKYSFPFYLLVIFLFFEYGRPQSFYPIIGALHPGVILHLLLFLCLLLEVKLFNLKNIPTKYFLGLILLMSLHVPIAVNNYWAYRIWRAMVLYFIVYLSVINFVDSFPKIEKYIDMWIIINIFCAIVGIKNGGKVPNSGFMGDENDFALVMNMAIPFAYFMFLETNSIKKKSLYLVAVGIFITANIASLSRGGFVGLIPVILYCWYKTPRKILSTIIVALMVTTILLAASPKYWDEVRSIKEQNIQTGTGEGRWYAWKITWRIFLDHPIIGVGQGNGPIFMGRYQSSEDLLHRPPIWGRAIHSLYFTLISELGLVGTLLFIAMLYYSHRDLKQILKLEKELLQKKTEENLVDFEGDLFINQLRKLRFIIFGMNGALIGFSISAIFLSVFYYPHFWLLIAIIVAINNIVKSKIYRTPVASCLR